MGILAKFTERKKLKAELNEIEYINAKRKSDIRAVITFSELAEDSMPNQSTRAEYSRLKARAEGIQDRIDQIFTAIRNRDVETARKLNNIIENALKDLTDLTFQTAEGA
ncbi:MAG: hypothetical protein J5966_09395 [Lachnospiraceae bacterium]|nr:hypothetical protein [Lachnospiraceae bacterium]